MPTVHHDISCTTSLATSPQQTAGTGQESTLPLCPGVPNAMHQCLHLSLMKEAPQLESARETISQVPRQKAHQSIAHIGSSEILPASL